MLLNKCTVTVAASASKMAPSAAEEAARRDLLGAVTLSELAAGVLAADKRAPAAGAAASEPYYLYVRVSPQQAPQPGAGHGGGGALSMSEWAPPSRWAWGGGVTGAVSGRRAVACAYLHRSLLPLA